MKQQVYVTEKTIIFDKMINTTKKLNYCRENLALNKLIKNNKNQPYCQMVIQPKLEKFEKVFKNRLKKK